MCHHNSHQDSNTQPKKDEYNVLSQLNQQLQENPPAPEATNTEAVLHGQDYEGYLSLYLEDGYYPNW